MPIILPMIIKIYALYAYIRLYFHIWCGTINDSIGRKTNIEKIYAYASELGKLSHFYILILLFPSTFCWYFWYFISETYTFSGLKLHLHTYVQSMQFPVISMVWRYTCIYKRQFTDKTLTFRQSMDLRASGASELGKFSHFYILILLFPSTFCWYFRYFVGTNDMLVGLHVPTDFRFPNVPTKLRKSIIGGGGGGNCPPAPPLATLMYHPSLESGRGEDVYPTLRDLRHWVIKWKSSFISSCWIPLWIRPKWYGAYNVCWFFC